jgi:hypothetical protein
MGLNAFDVALNAAYDALTDKYNAVKDTADILEASDDVGTNFGLLQAAILLASLPLGIREDLDFAESSFLRAEYQASERIRVTGVVTGISWQWSQHHERLAWEHFYRSQNALQRFYANVLISGSAAETT